VAHSLFDDFFPVCLTHFFHSFAAHLSAFGNQIILSLFDSILGDDQAIFLSFLDLGSFAKLHQPVVPF